MSLNDPPDEPGSCAMGCCESGQVRKEAAISGFSRVPQTSLGSSDGLFIYLEVLCIKHYTEALDQRFLIP